MDMKKSKTTKCIVLVQIFVLLLSGCGLSAQPNEKKQYTKTYLDVFDTVTTIIGREESEEAFQKKAEQIHETLVTYHQLFDIYNDYEGIVNLKTVNELAGKEPVVVDRKILDLLLLCKEEAELTEGAVNIALGSMLDIWHEARAEAIENPETAKLPDRNALENAMEHTDISQLLIDEEENTVFLADDKMKLNVGAIAKGYAVEKAIEGVTGNYLVSVGGNVRVTGPKTEEGDPWTVGVQDPDHPDTYRYKLCVTDGSVVTSGDYQRYFEVDGKRYHHIIDPKTLMPSAYYRSVTVVCKDSGRADAMSTALFNLPLEEGKVLAEKTGVQVLWIPISGDPVMTEGMEKLIAPFSSRFSGKTGR